MPIVVLVLVVVIVLLCLKAGGKDTGVGVGLSKEERELRRLPDESVNLFAFLDHPTAAMQAEYVRRHGSWPGYTAEDFAEDAREAQEVHKVAAALRERYEQNAEGTWVPKAGGQGTVDREESASVSPGPSLRRLPHEAIDLFPFLDAPTPAMKAEYVRRRGYWPDRSSLDVDMAEKAHHAALDLERRIEDPDFPYVAGAEGGWTLREDAPAYEDDGPPDFRPA